MNFLAHYYTLKPSEDIYTLLGSVLPDMTKDFSRIFNEKSLDGYDKFTELENVNMLKGVALHIKADDIFHKHALFLSFEKEAKEILNDVFGDTVKRKYVLAHVLVELLIDKYIINLKKKSLESFYEKLDLVNLKKANEFFEIIEITEETSCFKRNFKHFREKQFLYYLKDTEGVIFTLDKVFKKKVGHDFMENKILWNTAIEKISVEINGKIPGLLYDVKNQLYINEK